MTTVYLNIGSNKGDRHALIERAVALISYVFPQAQVRRAPVVESEPWGYVSPHMFLNLGVALDFADGPDPLRLLDAFQGIEREVSSDAHRYADGSYCDRGLDIDIIAIDKLQMQSERLTLPHPRAHLRPFVMQPLRQLAPPELADWIETRGRFRQ